MKGESCVFGWGYCYYDVEVFDFSKWRGGRGVLIFGDFVEGGFFCGDGVGLVW